MADRSKAASMAAYMKTEMPFYGVQKPDRLPLYRQLARQFAPRSKDSYEENVLALWSQPHREEKYTAIEYAFMFPEFVAPASIPLYESLIRAGSWWDFVDPLAINLVGHALMKERTALAPLLEKWSSDPDLWLRRSALIAQNHYKKQTDEKLLLAICLKLGHEKEFFIAKAIGWALREYSYVAPKTVARFTQEHKDKLAALSIREATRRLPRP